MSAIAREFECTPSAISYIIRKAEAAGAAEGKAGAEPAEAVTAESPATEADAQTAEAPQPAPQPAAQPATKPAEARTAESRPVESKAAEAKAADAKPAEAKLAEPKTAEPKTEEPSRPATTETLRLNRPDPQPAPPPAPAVAAPAPAAQPAAAGAAGRQEPSPPVDAVEGRLRETARGCLAAYRGWRQQPSESSIQALSDAVHELRKALARIEIDMSASRREEQAIRPIPIPAHRAARRPQ